MQRKYKRDNEIISEWKTVSEWGKAQREGYGTASI